jgi:hypothetical protein
MHAGPASVKAQKLQITKTVRQSIWSLEFGASLELGTWNLVLSPGVDSEPKTTTLFEP